LGLQIMLYRRRLRGFLQSAMRIRRTPRFACFAAALALASQAALGADSKGGSVANDRTASGNDSKSGASIADLEKAARANPNDARVWLQLGNAFLGANKFTDAENAAEKALKLDRKMKEGWSLLGIAHIAEGKAEAATKDLDAALKIDPEFAMAWLYRGIALRLMHDNQESVADVQKAIRLNPRLYHAHRTLAGWLAEVDDWEGVYSEAQTLVSLQPPNGEGWVVLGEADLRRGRWKEGVDEILKAQSLGYHLTFIGKLNLASGYSDLGRYQEAEKLLAEAGAENPNSEVVFFKQAAILGKLGKDQESVACYEKGLAINPRNPEGWENLAETHRRLMRFQEAYRCARNAVLADPHHWRGWVILTDCREALRSAKSFLKWDEPPQNRGPGAAPNPPQIIPDYSEVCEAARRARMEKKNDDIAPSALGFVCLGFENFDDATTAFESVLREAPGDGVALYGLKMALFANGRFSEARQRFRRVTKEKPEWSLAWLYLAEASLDNETLPDGIAALRMALDLKLKDPRVLTEIGQTSLEVAGMPGCKNPADLIAIAERTFRALVEIAPNDYSAYLRLAQVLFAKKDYEGAERIANDLLTLHGKSSAAWELLVTARFRQNHFAESIAAAESAIRDFPLEETVWRNWTGIYVGQKGSPATQEKLKQLLGELPESAPGGAWLGRLCEKEKRDSGIDYLIKAIALGDREYIVVNNTGLYYSRTGNLTKASEAFEMAVQSDPQSAEAWSNLGCTFFLLDKTSKAIDAYQHALKVNPKHVNALVNLAQAAAKSGDAQMAKEACDQLAEVNPALADQTRQRFLK